MDKLHQDWCSVYKVRVLLAFNPSSGLEWAPVTAEDQRYLVIDDQPYMDRSNDFSNKMFFWQSIFPC